MAYSKLQHLLLPLLLAVTLSPLPASAKDRTLTIANTCTYTLWMAYFTVSSGPWPQPDQVTGWEAPSGTVVTMTVQETWGGRVWARTNCDFTSDLPDYQQCETGGCVGGLECDTSSGTGVPPRTPSLIQPSEAVLPSPRLMPLFLSQVDGFNVPLAITNSASCPLSNCPFDLLLNCPSDLQKKNDAGTVIGCYTDCGATVSNKDEYCCAGAYNLPSTCPSSSEVLFPDHRVPSIVSFRITSGTALFTCTDEVDYTITFCPSDNLYDDSA
ncbi:thaumatin [Leucosporidium creatinivorum]|uniref:Thaumatin n=1 Tax=Leucosporidium creatinivorum TaxID=106004 RepID=A0A1Y2FZY6_9BASI|nr:thaumatin [Leucosporidium creatinivorum]